MLENAATFNVHHSDGEVVVAVAGETHSFAGERSPVAGTNYRGAQALPETSHSYPRRADINQSAKLFALDVNVCDVGRTALVRLEPEDPLRCQVSVPARRFVFGCYPTFGDGFTRR